MDPSYSQVPREVPRDEVFDMTNIQAGGVCHRFIDRALSHNTVSPALWRSFRQNVVDVSVRIGKTR